jgi:hypothetical protein
MNKSACFVIRHLNSGLNILFATFFLVVFERETLNAQQLPEAETIDVALEGRKVSVQLYERRKDGVSKYYVTPIPVLNHALLASEIQKLTKTDGNEQEIIAEVKIWSDEHRKSCWEAIRTKRGFEKREDGDLNVNLMQIASEPLFYFEGLTVVSKDPTPPASGESSIGIHTHRVRLKGQVRDFERFLQKPKASISFQIKASNPKKIEYLFKGHSKASIEAVVNILQDEKFKNKLIITTGGGSAQFGLIGTLASLFSLGFTGNAARSFTEEEAVRHRFITRDAYDMITKSLDESMTAEIHSYNGGALKNVGEQLVTATLQRFQEYSPGTDPTFKALDEEMKSRRNQLDLRDKNNELFKDTVVLELGSLLASGTVGLNDSRNFMGSVTVGTVVASGTLDEKQIRNYAVNLQTEHKGRMEGYIPSDIRAKIVSLSGLSRTFSASVYCIDEDASSLLPLSSQILFTNGSVADTIHVELSAKEAGEANGRLTLRVLLSWRLGNYQGDQITLKSVRRTGVGTGSDSADSALYTRQFPRYGVGRKLSEEVRLIDFDVVELPKDQLKNWLSNTKYVFVFSHSQSGSVVNVEKEIHLQDQN